MTSACIVPASISDSPTLQNRDLQIDVYGKRQNAIINEVFYFRPTT